MEIAYFSLALLQSFAVSLGVGASTLAILNHIVANKDGTLDESERSLMHIVYKVLRVSMGVVLVTLILQGILTAPSYGLAYFHPFLVFVWFVVLMLYFNAIMMTKRIMPRSIGPGLQAATWYSLAVLYFLAAERLIAFSYTQLFGAYVVFVFVAIIVVNSTLAYFRSRVT